MSHLPPQGIGSAETTSDVDEPAAGFDPARILEEWDNPEVMARMRVEESFLRTCIFRGLNDLKRAFDSAHIAHFRAADFLQVIARCSRLGIRIIGIEICGPAGEDVEIEIPEANSNAWCVSLVQKHQDRSDLSFCATYAVPGCVLALPPTSSEFLDRA